MNDAGLITNDRAGVFFVLLLQPQVTGNTHLRGHFHPLNIAVLFSPFLFVVFEMVFKRSDFFPPHYEMGTGGCTRVFRV